jgi:hypothetical protein
MNIMTDLKVSSCISDGVLGFIGYEWDTWQCQMMHG